MSKFKVGDKVTCKGYPDDIFIYIVRDINGLAILKFTNKAELLYASHNWLKLAEEAAANTTEANQDEYTGGSSNYYKVFVKNPVTLESPYEAECSDIIEALNMTFAEGNAFKAIWRKAKARQGVKKKGYDNGIYDSEKVIFFGERMLVEAKENANLGG